MSDLLYKILLALVFILGIIFLWVWKVYNSLIRARNQVKTDLADINVYLKQKLELVDRLVDLVKTYSKHEKETLENVARARSALEKAGPEHTEKADNILRETLRSLMLVVEDYPNLQASKNFQQLREDLKGLEGKIAYYREEYNRSVQKYNNKVETFPNVLLASLLGFKSQSFFQLREEK